MKLVLVLLCVLSIGGIVDDSLDTGDLFIPQKVSIPAADLIPDYAKELDRLELPWDGRVNVEHRELMWVTIEETFQALEVDERIKLIKFVRNYPLYAKLPAYITWSSVTDAWSVASRKFVEKIRRLPR